jgi:hypothetical protein
MEEETRNARSKDFIYYEKMDKVLDNRLADHAVDFYSCFGWDLVSSEAKDISHKLLTFRRLRKIPHKEELNNLQYQAENIKGEFNKALWKKNNRPMIIAIGYGTLTSVIFGVGLALAINSNGSNALLVWGIIMAIVGFCGLGMNYPVYLFLSNKSNSGLKEDLSKLDDKIADICEQAQKLIADNSKEDNENQKGQE